MPALSVAMMLFVTVADAQGAHDAAGVYLIEDGANAIHLSDRPRSQADRLLVAAASDAGAQDTAPIFRTVPSDDPVDRAVQRAAQAHAIDPQLLHAVIAAESAYAVRAVSRRGALGLMQLMPETARRYGVTDPFDVSQNIGAGALHLRQLLDRFDQNLVLALAAYNAGADAVVRYGRHVPPFAETRAYVPRVLQRLSALRTGLKVAAPRAALGTARLSAL